jgi:hypothetical protein
MDAHDEWREAFPAARDGCRRWSNTPAVGTALAFAAYAAQVARAGESPRSRSSARQLPPHSKGAADAAAARLPASTDSPRV